MKEENKENSDGKPRSISFDIKDDSKKTKKKKRMCYV